MSYIIISIHGTIQEFWHRNSMLQGLELVQANVKSRKNTLATEKKIFGEKQCMKRERERGKKKDCCEDILVKPPRVAHASRLDQNSRTLTDAGTTQVEYASRLDQKAAMSTHSHSSNHILIFSRFKGCI